MKILIIGALGNMGKRYTAICKYLGHEVIGVDINDNWKDEYQDFDKAIVCSPTDSHITDCRALAEMEIDFLCEKPVDKDPEKIHRLIDLCEKNGVDGRMVCNWAFVNETHRIPKTNRIRYDNYNTGKDGLAWDCIQLIYLADGMPSLATDKPFLDCHINETRVNEGHIALSYVAMIRAWVENNPLVWSLEDAKKATEKVLLYMEVNK